MRDRKRCGLGDRRVANQHIINLNWPDLLAASINQIFLPAVKCEEAFLIEATDVARFKPTIDEGCSIEFWGIKIAGNYSGTAHQNFALLAGRKPTSILSDDDDGIWPRNAACA